MTCLTEPLPSRRLGSLIGLASILMDEFLRGQNSLSYVHAFHWTVIVLGLVTLLASGLFGCLPVQQK